MPPPVSTPSSSRSPPGPSRQRPPNGRCRRRRRLRTFDRIGYFLTVGVRMRKIFNRRRVVVGLAALLVGSAPAVATAGTGDVVADALRRMSLEEKVGQLIVTYAYGATVDASDPASVAANRRQHGVDNAEQLIRKYH